MGGPNSGPHRTSRLKYESAKRFDVMELRDQARNDHWEDGHVVRLSYPAPHTGRPITAKVEVSFTEQPFGGRRVWWSCPECPARVRYLFGGRPDAGQPYRIACAVCQRILYPCQHEGRVRRCRRQLKKLEVRLGGDPRTMRPPGGLKRCTWGRLAARHLSHRQILANYRRASLRLWMRKHLWPVDPLEAEAILARFGLTKDGDAI